jgi:arylsulfatase A
MRMFGGGGDSIPYKPSDYALAPSGYTHDQKSKWANMRNLDESVRRIVDTLAALGIDDNTIVIFTSDNGAANDGLAASMFSNKPYSGEKRQNAEGGVRVPMIWYHPGTVPAMTIDSLTALVDFKKTFIEGVCGSTVTESSDGVNFYPLLSGSSIPTRYYIGATIENRLWAVYKGSMWKLTNNNTSSVGASSSLGENIVLYNMQSDPTESTDVSGSNSSVVSELTAIRTAATVSASRTIISYNTPPAGWTTYPRWWTDPWFFYSSDYLYQIQQIDKN